MLQLQKTTKSNTSTMSCKPRTKIANHDLLPVVLGTYMHVGSDNFNYEREMERQGCGVMNDNGQRSGEFCSVNNLVVGGITTLLGILGDF